MSEQNKAIVRRYIEDAVSSRNLDLIDELFTEDCLDHHIPSELPRGPQGIKMFHNMMGGAFPDVRGVIKDQIAEGDKVVTYLEVLGTHQGEFMGLPATGNQISVTAMTIARFSDGKIAEWWENADTLGLMQQVGAIAA